MFTADPNAIYLGDNGRALCGAHLGCTASITGRDLSGQSIYRLRPQDKVWPGAEHITCEVCGKGWTAKA